MLIVDGIIVSEEIFEAYFCCDLSKCKGACCIEGDMGAPLEMKELEDIEQNLEQVLPFLPDYNRIEIREKGFHSTYKKLKGPGTRLMKDGSCVFSFRDARGILKCGIEESYMKGKSDFRKPISCHLYPIRIESDEQTGLKRIEYDRWDICNAACSLGSSIQLPLFKFVKNALIRNFGEAFYHSLEMIYDSRKPL